MLANCPSPQADSLRRAIARRAAAGESREHIEADLRATYGDVIRAAPSYRGFGLVAWLMPLLAMVIAAVGVDLWLRRARRTGTRRAIATARMPSIVHDTTDPAANGAPSPPSADDLAELDTLLRRDE